MDGCRILDQLLDDIADNPYDWCLSTAGFYFENDKRNIELYCRKKRSRYILRGTSGRGGLFYEFSRAETQMLKNALRIHRLFMRQSIDLEKDFPKGEPKKELI